jgi:hypothetical protein
MPWRFVHDRLGWNMRMTNLQAAIGLAQLERLDEFIARKRAMGARYDQRLHDVAAVQRPAPRSEGAENHYWVYGLVVDEATGLGTRVAVVITAVVLAPLAEELVFRGVLLRALAHRLPRWAAVLVSAGAFAVGHLLDPNAGLAVPALFVAGLVLARQVLKSGRLGGAIAMHAGFNLLSVLLLFFT